MYVPDAFIAPQESIEFVSAGKYVNDTDDVEMTPRKSVPFTDRVVNPDVDGADISDPDSAQSAVDVELKLSYEY